jgi:hypothetical protein
MRPKSIYVLRDRESILTYVELQNKQYIFKSKYNKHENNYILLKFKEVRTNCRYFCSMQITENNTQYLARTFRKDSQPSFRGGETSLDIFW